MPHGANVLPLARCAAHVAAFERNGWICVRVRGSHHILTKDGHDATLSIPDHGNVKRGLLARQIKLAGLTEDQYLDLFYGGKKR